MDVWVTGGIFVAAYVLIATDRVDRTLVAPLAGFLVIALGIVDQHAAFEAIDLKVILLLAGMMVIASTLAKTGLFEWLAIRSVQLSPRVAVGLVRQLSRDRPHFTPRQTADASSPSSAQIAPRTGSRTPGLMS